MMAASSDAIRGVIVSTKQEELELLKLCDQGMSYAAVGLKLYVPHSAAAEEILGHHTEVVVNKFEDRLFIIVTQYMKIGTVIEVKRDLISDEVQENIPIFSTRVLLGKDEPIMHVVAKTIVTELNPPIPVLLTLALKDTSQDTACAIIRMIQSCL